MTNVKQLSSNDLNNINGGDWEWPWTLIYNAAYDLGHNIGQLASGNSGAGEDDCE